MIYIVVGILCAAVGIGLGFFLSKSIANQKIGNAEKEAKKIIEVAEKEAKSIQKVKTLEAKEQYLQYKAQYNQEVEKTNKRLEQQERSLQDRERDLKNKLGNIERKQKEINSIRENLSKQLGIIDKKQKDLDNLSSSYSQKLENIAQISAEDAKLELINSLKEQAKIDAMAQVKIIADEAKITANKEAKKILVQTLQRIGAEQAIENSVSVFNLSNDDQKGQIIGREGRNVRALEAACGVSILVDDTPEAIVISCFDPLRREIAKLSLQKLIADGRIHPTRIEEVVAKTKKQLDEHVIEIGERTVIELGINGLHPELIKYVGRMRFRSSYGQNLLQHSKEVAKMCAVMAAELGLNPKQAKRAGLLHDIGKVPEEETELPHALLGMKLAKKYGEQPAVCNAIGAHHDEIEMEYMISPIIQICDAISGARPGARRDIMDHYVERLKELEATAIEFDGVEKAYALQAGRELRVLVESDQVSDKQAEELSFKISDKIQNDMQYPGQVKVTVIREMRAVSYAK